MSKVLGISRFDGTRVWIEVDVRPVMDEFQGELIVTSFRDITERKTAEERARMLSASLESSTDALAQSEERFRSLVQRSSDVAFVLDQDGVITYASPAAARFGYVPDALIGTPSGDLIHPDDVARHRDRVLDAVGHTGSATVEWRFRQADGSYCWVEQILTDLHDVPAVAGWVANVRDITDRREAQAERVEAEERYRQGFERSAFGLGVLDLDQTFTSVNPALAELLGHTPDRLVGRRPLEFLHPTESESARSGFDQLLSDDVPFYKREHRMVRRDGSIVSVLIDMTLVRDADGEPSYYFVQVRDITDRKRAEEALAHQALHDDLTHLPNRLLLVDRLAHSLARAERTDSNVAVLFLDLDRFKLVNDGLGHVVGDQLLIEVANRLTRSIRTSDTVARFGGDEFVIVREDVADATEAVEFAERMIAVLHEPISLSGREHDATASVGIALGGVESSAEQLLRDADAAMYRAKDLGRARWSCSATSSNSRWRPASTSRARSATRSSATSSSCCTNRSCVSPTVASSAPKRCCAGTAPVTVSSSLRSSSRSRRRRG